MTTIKNENTKILRTALRGEVDNIRVYEFEISYTRTFDDENLGEGFEDRTTKIQIIRVGAGVAFPTTFAEYTYFTNRKVFDKAMGTL